MASIIEIREDDVDIFDPKTNKLKPKNSVYEIFNISAPVGPGMANHFGDVVVVQALLNVIYLDGTKQATIEFWSGHDGSPPEYKGYQTPKVTGSFDKNTATAIKLFKPTRPHVCAKLTASYALFLFREGSSRSVEVEMRLSTISTMPPAATCPPDLD
jgi:hypothetical protein